MEYVSRSELGWPASAAPDQVVTVEGLKIHYEGTSVPVEAHTKCAGRWTQIRNSHLANTAEGYSDVAYNWAVCNHGVIFEGRGWGKQTGANGSQALNRPHNAILWMGGTSGVTVPSDAAVAAIKGLVAYLRSRGAGKDILGHRDGYATACPGDAMYGLVVSGKLEPSLLPPPAPAPEEPVIIPVSVHNSIDVEIEAGVRTGLAFTPGGVLHGAGVIHSTIANVQFLAPADTLIDGYFYLTNADGSSPSDYTVISKVGGGGHQFLNAGEVPAGKTLRFAVVADKPVTVVHRHLSGVRVA